MAAPDAAIHAFLAPKRNDPALQKTLHLPVTRIPSMSLRALAKQSIFFHPECVKDGLFGKG